MSRFSLAVVAALACLAAQPALADFDEPIVGGTQVPAGSYPWMVSLQSGGRHVCGGFLVRRNVVITAAHCMGGSRTVGIKGSGTQTSTTDVYQVEASKSHPSYSSVSGGYDVAILKLRPKNGNLPAANLPVSYDTSSTSTSQYAGQNLKVIGWGALREGGGSPRHLQQVVVPGVSNSECDRRSYPGSVTSTMLCAGFAQGGKDSCQGDSGGPLFIEGGSVVGIVSWGHGCARPNKYGVYARVNALLNFITPTVNQYAGSTQPPTTGPPTTGPPTSSCEDVTINGQPWYDSDGPRYNCQWYAVGDRCRRYGNSYSNFGYTANTACCVCKNQALRSEFPDPGCQCDGGSGYYDQCMAGSVSGVAEWQGACFVDSHNGKSQKPRCNVPEGTSLHFSDNYQRWYIKGCTALPRIDGRYVENNAVPLDGLPTTEQSSSYTTQLVGGVVGAAVGSALVTAGVAVVLAKKRNAATLSPSVVSAYDL